MPRFTVAIPTYNRGHYLSYMLSCVLQQTYRDFEIVISDNASGDNTDEVVRRFEDKRIRYVRQPEFLCAGDNWAACADLAQADWIVFHQDDDLLNPCFLERCDHAIRKFPKIVMYAAECGYSKDITRNQGTSLCGVPLCHYWDRPQPRLIPGAQIAALSWFICPFSPPAQATPTHLCRKHFPRGPEAVFVGEHYFTSHVACEGEIAFDGYVGAILRQHDDRLTHTIPDVTRRWREAPFVALRALFEENKIDWQSALRAILPELPLTYREWMLDEYVLNEFIAQEAIEILAASIATEKGISSVKCASTLRAEKLEKLKPPPVGRLDRWKLPKPMTRVIRGLLYAAGKNYA